MKSVGIIAKPGKPELATLVPELRGWLEQHGYAVFVDEGTAPFAGDAPMVEREKMLERRPEFIVVLGGDGTLLAAARAVTKSAIPLLGVNLGSLGFLTEVPLSELYPTLEAASENRCAVESRAMLHCQVVRGQECLASYDALNDVVVSKTALARIADFDVILDQVFVSNYKADGVILSTPTGSTAYSLAAGGPILAPDVEAFAITPISPHALTNRPLVVRDVAQIDLVVRSAQEEAFLTVDGQTGMPLKDGDRLRCRKSEHKIRLLRLREKTFFDVLRSKLKWGQR
jgi:NAD+ kinase